MSHDKDALLPQQGMWKLIAPDGRTWEADSPLKAVSAEQRERIPADVQLARIAAALAEKDDGGLKMHDPEGQRRCGFSSDDDAMDEGDSSWCIDPDMGAR